ncbi:hypothetical protein [Janthinobacterium sp. UMAB-60]|uniref:hypothetical protein n=1 Tax=Janthinobacterium sp. UMAB-60 TaxID=1365365 RepID=UPI001C59B639|nr:hypothetical protein [Janthinobacterium sp. UMAB-60]
MASKPQIGTGNATVINTGEEVIVSITVANIGNETASKVFLTGATLGAARRISPQNFPVYIGSLTNEGSGSIGARFSHTGLTPGQQYLLTLRGTYEAGGTLGFVVNRYVMIPQPAPYASPRLRSHVNVLLNNATWTYTIFNDEPLGSSLYIAAFHLDIAASAAVTACALRRRMARASACTAILLVPVYPPAAPTTIAHRDTVAPAQIVAAAPHCAGHCAPT